MQKAPVVPHNAMDVIADRVYLFQMVPMIYMAPTLVLPLITGVMALAPAPHQPNVWTSAPHITTARMAQPITVLTIAGCRTAIA